jgi:hypothetical protein
LRAIVDLDAVSLAHDQRDTTDRTRHSSGRISHWRVSISSSSIRRSHNVIDLHRAHSMRSDITIASWQLPEGPGPRRPYRQQHVGLQPSSGFGAMLDTATAASLPGYAASRRSHDQPSGDDDRSRRSLGQNPGYALTPLAVLDASPIAAASPRE